MKRWETAIAVIAITFVLTANVRAATKKFNRTMSVPAKYPTIQCAIDDAYDGDTIVVAPGRYVETIDFQGKEIVVKSSGGPDRTTIDGGQNGCVVFFYSQETNRSVLSGFTITNGTGRFLPSAFYGGGVLCIFNSNPTINNNIISGNSADLGGGICSYYSSPVIECNIVEFNETTLFSGGGITTVGRNAKIACNVIRNNYSRENGGGIAVYDAQPLFLNNTVTGNDAAFAGDGMYCSYFSEAIITNSIFWKNPGISEGEVCIDRSSTLHVDHSIINSIRIEPGGNVKWGEGNTFIDPGIQKNNPHLPAWSPCRDAGVPGGDGAANSGLDFEGDPRVVGERINIGADEYCRFFDGR